MATSCEISNPTNWDFECPSTTYNCYRCNNTFDSDDLIIKKQLFKNGITHQRVECPNECFLGYKAQILSPSSPFPYGKFRGKELKEIPTSYLVWVLNNQELIQLVRLQSQRQV